MTAKEKYITFCEKHFVQLFFKPYWLNIYNTKWEVISEEENNDFVFFIYNIEKKINFKIIRNSFLTPYSGFLFSDNRISDISKQKLINKVLNQLPSFHELHIDLHPDLGTKFKFEPCQTEIKITNILSIADMQKTFDAYRPSLKRQINKAKKSITIQEMDDIKLFYELHKKTFLKQELKTITPFEAFEKTWKVCKKSKCGKLLFAFDENENVHAALFLTYDEEQAYYLAGGTDAKFYGSGAMSYLMHYAINLSSGVHKKYFDFEGSMLPNVNRFFKNFNPVEIQYTSILKMESVFLKLLKKIRA